MPLGSLDSSATSSSLQGSPCPRSASRENCRSRRVSSCGNEPSSCDRFIPARVTSNSNTPWRDHCIRKLFEPTGLHEDGAGIASNRIDGIPESNAATDGQSLTPRAPNSFDMHLVNALFESNIASPSPASSESHLNHRGMSKILQFHPGLAQHHAQDRDFFQTSPSSTSILRDIYDHNRCLNNPLLSPVHGRPQALHRRHICSTPDRILDSPDIIDDYYLNLLHWSSQNVVGIALKNSVYIWHAATSTTTLLMESPNPQEPISSVRWSEDGTKLAVGINCVQLWDVERRRLIRTIKGHEARVSVLAWRTGCRNVLTSGSRDSTIRIEDIRVPSPSSESSSTVDVLRGHTQEVCGLQWSPDGTQLASGGNDNVCLVWDAQATSRHRLLLDKHQAAVKALAWCPFQARLLATGGGTADRHIRFWNSSSGQCVGAVDTYSQVCGLVWSEHERELLSAHGFSKNQLTIWSYPTMRRVADLVGHASRVLHLALSPDGTTVCSASADETLRFWKVFRSLDRKPGGASRGRLHGQQLGGSLKTLDIR